MLTAAARRRSRRLLIPAALALATAGCGSSVATGPTTTTIPVGTIPTSTTASTATTVPATVVPAAPQPTAADAAAALMTNWEQNDRAVALRVATKQAVATLFANAYAGQTTVLRQCSQSPPIVCTYGPNGGANPADALYNLSATQVGGLWYISTVDVEG